MIFLVLDLKKKQKKKQRKPPDLPCLGLFVIKKKKWTAWASNPGRSRDKQEHYRQTAIQLEKKVIKPIMLIC